MPGSVSLKPYKRAPQGRSLRASNPLTQCETGKGCLGIELTPNADHGSTRPSISEQRHWAMGHLLHL
ncbi:uncharacterized protein PST29_3441 [Pseudomonas sp. St29]|nr:uncharacterized protein PST29_3441 [Pseudomonas sp. St29]